MFVRSLILAHKKLLLFGGTGFVGEHIAAKALLRGYRVVVASRGGTPKPSSSLAHLAHRVNTIGRHDAALEPTQSLHQVQPGAAAASSIGRSECESSVEKVHYQGKMHALEFVSIDASSRNQVFHLMHDHPDTTAVISCVGVLTRDYDEARRLNGDANTHICAGVYHPKLMHHVQKLVYISAEPYHQYSPRVIGSKQLLKGYFHGKQIAERAVLENLGERGVVLRPGWIYGNVPIYLPSVTDPVGSMWKLPLGIIGKPLEAFLSAVRCRKLLLPPIDVNTVAEVAMRACDWASLPHVDVSGVLDYYRMQQVLCLDDPTSATVANSGKSSAKQG